ncbi:uncharacterized protein [Ambystoma mexicanum]|uniref:uncharacterized protein isoform X3 n=1 Tax=Ambystoma mexicanum TaxID=8296 RepID=UPI0037E767A2
MEPSTTIGDFFRTLYEMGFNEAQVQAAVQAGVFGVQDAAEWLLQGGELHQRLHGTSAEQSVPGAIAAFNLPRIQDLPSSPGTSITDSSSQESLGSPSPWHGDVTSPGSRMKLDKKEFEEQQRDKLAQELKAEKRNKKKEHEMVLKRIADDRKMLQEKKQGTSKSDTSPQKAQRLGGKVQTAVDNYCLLVIRLPSGDSMRERFCADSLLHTVVEHISGLHPHLQNFDLLQTFPKRNFSVNEQSFTLKALGLTPNATLCIRINEQKQAEDSTMVLGHTSPTHGQMEEMQPSSEPLESRPLALPIEHYSWGRGESLGLQTEAITPEALMREGEDLLPILSSPAHRITPGNPGIHGLWEASSSRHHRWGRGQKLIPEGLEDEVEQSDEDSEEDVNPGHAREHLPPRNRIIGQREHLWPSEGNRLRTGDQGTGPNAVGNPLPPEDLPGAMAQAAAERLHNTSHEEQSLRQQPSKRLYPLPQVPSLFHLTIRATVTLMTAPSMQYCSSLASLTPELAEHLITHMVREKLLRPKTLELFFGCQIQKIVLNCYPYATNELLRQLRAFHTLKHLSLVSCSLITDQGLSVLTHLQKLQYVNLCACVKLTDSCLQSLKGLEHVSHLFLDQTKVSDSGMIDYLESAPPCLTQLSLNQTGITEKTLSILPQQVPQLRTLSIKQTQVTDLSALQELKSLHTLHIDNTSISEDSLLAIADHPAISTLTLYGVQSIDGNRVLQLISGLHLVHLVLPSRHTITDTGLSFLCHLQGLLELDLTDYSHISDEGVQHLAHLKRLKKLSLRNTPVTDAGLPYLQNLREMEDLCLDRTNVTSIGVSRCIPSLAHLQVLGLACTPVGDNVLLLGVQHCKQLLKLNLSRTRITDRGLQYLRNMKISQVNLDGTGVTTTGVSNLISCCPSLLSIRASNLQVLLNDQVSDEELPS